MTQSSVLFIGTVLAAVVGYYKIVLTITNSRKTILMLIALLLGWLLLQAILANEVYGETVVHFPPKIILMGILPAVVIVGLLFYIKKIKQTVLMLPATLLTAIHIIRIPVEIVIYFLYYEKQLPQILTFEGYNMDIWMGISCPFIWWLAKKHLHIYRRVIIAWNILSIISLTVIVVLSTLSTATPFQVFGHHQPNLAMVKFPYVWLPVFIVPLIYFCSITTLYKLYHNI